jgi:hypothetical protein
MSRKGVEGSLSGGGRALSVIARRRRVLAGGVAAAILFTAAGSAHADWDRWERWEDRQPVPRREEPADWQRWERRHPVAKRPAQAKKAPSQQAKKAPKALQMPLIAISIANQRLTLYDRGEVVAHAPVSTGMPGHPTPTGVFSVIQKQVFHESNIYSGAPMPYMQRITWSGVAMHAGVLPGHPASHGCIRMPYDFAVKLYGLTRAGARVIITRNEIAPVAFEHPGLFQLPKPTLDKVGELTEPARPAAMPAAAVRTAQRQSATMLSDASNGQAPAGNFKPRPEATAAAPPQDAALPVTAPADNAPAEPHEMAAAADAPAVLRQDSHDGAQDVVEAGPQDRAPTGADTRAQLGTQDGAKNGAQNGADVSAPSFEPSTGTVMVKPIMVTPPQPVELPKAFELARPPAKPESATTVFEQTSPTPKAEGATTVFEQTSPTPNAESAPKAFEPASPTPNSESAPKPESAESVVPFGPERPLRPGPITVFVSKKEGKVFVRKGFQPVFSAPVTVARPELPLGTHLFTASEAMPDGVSFRWLELSLSDETARKVEALREPKGYRSRYGQKTVAPAVARTASAAEALDRVGIPAPALARISALMSAGATLIISDQGLGPETGTETDFIVLTR